MLFFKTYRFDEIDELRPIVGKHNLHLASTFLAEAFHKDIPFGDKHRWHFARKVLRFLSHCEWRMYENKTTILPISKKELEDWFGKNYLVYMNWLHEKMVLCPILTNSKAYDMNLGICKSWRFYKRYVNDARTLCVFTETRGKREIELKSDTGYDPVLVETIRNLEVDLLPAIKAEIAHCLLDSQKLRHRLGALFCLWDKRFIHKGRNVNRVFHSATNISRVSRPFLHVKGERFHNIDVVNCQPLLLAALLKKEGLEVDGSYLEDVQNGTFYERFITSDSTRDETKVKLYRNIFFGVKVASSEAVRFQELYPMAWIGLSKFRERLATSLQNIEAEIFTTVVPKKSNAWWPLHDAVYFTNIDDAEEVKSQISSGFNKYGVDPQLIVTQA